MRSSKTNKAEYTVSSVLSWERERNSLNGNPRFSFVIATACGRVFSGTTRPDAGWVYGLRSEPRLDRVTIAITPSGRCYMDNATEREA